MPAGMCRPQSMRNIDFHTTDTRLVIENTGNGVDVVLEYYHKGEIIYAEFLVNHRKNIPCQIVLKGKFSQELQTVLFPG